MTRRTIVAEWEAPSLFPYVALDPVVPGGLFSEPIPDPNIDHYEVDRFEQEEREWISVGNPRTPRVEFPAEYEKVAGGDEWSLSSIPQNRPYSNCSVFKMFSRELNSGRSWVAY